MVGFGCSGGDEQDFQGSCPTPIVTRSDDRVVLEGGEAAVVEEVDRETRDLQLPQDCVLKAKLRPRLQWTPELHTRFVDAVNQLGGPHKSTPKKVQQAMGIQGITLFQVKSHLQKYRLGRYSGKEWTEGTQICSQDLEEGLSTRRTPLQLPQTARMPSDELVMAAADEERIRMQIEAGRQLQLWQDAEQRYMNFAMENAHKKLAEQFFGGAIAAGVLNGVSGLGTMELYPAYQMTAGSRMQPSLEGHSTSYGRSENSSVENFQTCTEDDEKTEQSLDDDPAEAYLIDPDPDME
ncbi:protein PHR1-LIKE 3-like [Pyrus communis]|uniref:protein PHR1-LIKE 3-like n=1 Tax=Pyrus communis TaxID=23211 RepID=UPI0035BF3048